jgi:hypothetical protein
MKTRKDILSNGLWEEKFIWILGISIYLILFVLSIYYYQERIGTIDNAFQTFLLIGENKITVMANRWPAVIIRVIPYLLFKSGLSLSLIMISFSISYVLFHAIIFYIVFKTLRSPRLALLQLFVLLLVCSDGFYWCNSEQIQGLSVVLLFLAIFYLPNKVHSWTQSLLMFLTAIVILFYHPLLLVPILFVLAFNCINKKQILWDHVVIGVGFTGLWFLKSLLFPNWYDNMKSAEFANNFKLYIGNILDLPSLGVFSTELFSKYYLLLIGAILVSIHFIYQKKYIPLLFVSLSSIGYLLLVLIGSPDLKFSYYTEINFYPLVILLFYPLLVSIEAIKIPKIYIRGIITGLLLISIIRIVSYSEVYHQRLSWIEHTIQHQNCNKLIFQDIQIPESIRMQTWSLPYESAILSSGNKYNRTMHPDIQKYKSEEGYTDITFVTSFKILDKGFFTSSYFEWPEGNYCPLVTSN